MQHRYYAPMLFLLASLASTKGFSQEGKTTVTTQQRDTEEQIDIKTKQEPSETEKNLLKKLNEFSSEFAKSTDKTVQIGLSISYRRLHEHYEDSYTVARISPIDSTLRVAKLDPKDLILSTCIIVSPFVKGERINEKYDEIGQKIKDTDGKQKLKHQLEYGVWYIIRNSSAYININLVEFNKAETNLPFNKSVEGGFGYCLKLAPRAYFRIGNELIFSPQLTPESATYIGKKLPGVNTTGQLNENKDYFTTKNVIAWSYGLILAF